MLLQICKTVAAVGAFTFECVETKCNVSYAINLIENNYSSFYVFRSPRKTYNSFPFDL